MIEISVLPAGNNIGINYAAASSNVRYVALLNNDIVLHPHCLTELVISAEKDAGIGSCQPKMLLMDTPELVDTMGISMLISDRRCGFAWPWASG